MKRIFTFLFTILVIQYSNAQTLSGTSPIIYNSTTGAVSIKPASDTTGGYITNGQQFIGGLKIFTSANIQINTNNRIGVGSGGQATNAAFGYGTLVHNTTGGSNIAIGYNAMVSNTTGNNNIAMGYSALSSPSTANNNIALGYAVGLILTGSNNTLIGNGQVAYKATAAHDNSAFGSASAYDLTTGAFNNFFGRASGTGIVAGNYNTIVGQNTSIGDVSNYVVIADGQGHNRIIVDQNGNTGIGASAPDAKLTVGGTVHASAVLVDQTVQATPDYVFDKDYDLSSLKDVKTYIDKNHHLSEIPSAEQVAKDGINLGEMNAKLLKKIEELTLYLIEKDNELKLQKKLLINQQNQLNNVKKKLHI
jgi:hypothetical protein